MDWKIKSRSPVENGDSNYCEPAAQVIDVKSIQVRPGPITFVCKVRLHNCMVYVGKKKRTACEANTSHAKAFPKRSEA